MNDLTQHSRRTFLMKIAILLNGIVGVFLAIPIIGYLLGPLLKKDSSYNYWTPLGSLDQFPVGETRLANYHNPVGVAWDGQTGTIPCWVRCVATGKFQVFAINCAHLGCPVRWFPQSKLFMCPCHGGVYYQDGTRASGPPLRGLFQYSYKIAGDQLMIKAGELPTLSTQASVAKPEHSPCQG
jgi:Rieske Fe-S protein